MRLLLAAAVLAGLVLWLHSRPPDTFDLRLLQRCLVAEGVPARRSAPRTLAANGAVLVRLDRGGHVAFHADDGRVSTCLDRLAGRHLRLRH